jgi:hypothetical protein
MQVTLTCFSDSRTRRLHYKGNATFGRAAGYLRWGMMKRMTYFIALDIEVEAPVPSHPALPCHMPSASLSALSVKRSCWHTARDYF